MIIGNLDNRSTNFSLENHLQHSTKSNMIDACRFFGFKINKSLKKKEFIASTARAFLVFTNHWMSALRKDEALLLQKLVEAGPNTYIKWPGGWLSNVFEEYDLLLVDESEIGQGIVGYMICDELRKAVAPHIADLFASDKQQQQWEIEQYAYGLANLYGYIPLSETISRLQKIWKKSISEEQLLKVLYSGSISRFYFIVDLNFSTTYLHSPFIDDEELDMGVELQSKENKDYKEFRDDVIYKAGELPYPLVVEPSISREAMNIFTERLRMTESKATFNMQQIWIEKQFGLDNPMSAILPLIDGKLDSMHDLEMAVSSLVDYINTIPVWTFRGHSSEEINRLLESQRPNQAPPQIIPGPGMQSLGQDFTLGMLEFANDLYYNTMMSSKKVGRNDPCPCGSGRKYKHCCGRCNPN